MPKDYKKIISEGFYMGNKKSPRGRTVADLITILQQLPGELVINDQLNSSEETDEATFFVDVFNINTPSRIQVEISNVVLFDGEEDEDE